MLHEVGCVGHETDLCKDNMADKVLSWTTLSHTLQATLRSSA